MLRDEASKILREAECVNENETLPFREVGSVLHGPELGFGIGIIITDRGSRRVSRSNNFESVGSAFESWQARF